MRNEPWRAGERTFLDANVLLLAFRGSGEEAVAAASLLEEEREFVASDVLRLELLPKPDYNKRSEELQFSEEYFRSATEVVETTPHLVQSAEQEARLAGLSAIDSLHVAAANQVSVDEFVTAELPTKPLFRVQGIRMVSIA